MKTKSSLFLWILCVTAFPLTIWPLLYASTIFGMEFGVSTIFRDADMRMALGWLLPCIAAGWMGIGAGRLRKWLYAHSKEEAPVVRDRFEERIVAEEKPWMIALSNLTLLVPFVLAIIWMIIAFAFELVTLIGVLSMFFCIIYGIRAVDKVYAEILPRLMLIVAMGCGVVGVLFIGSLDAQYDPSMLIWPFFIEAVICAVAQNQGNIDFMMHRRKHDLRHLPKQVRWYSLFVTGAVLALIFAVVLLRPQITWLFGQVLQMLKVLLRLFLMFIIWLMGLGNAGTDEAGGSESTGEQMEGFMDPDAQAGPWWDYIMGAILIGLAIFFIRAYHRDIARAFREGWRRIKQYIKDKLFAVPVMQKLAAVVESKSEYYTDEIEILTIDETDRRQDVFKLRDWRRKVRRAAGEAPSQERFRSGYALGLQWLMWKGVAIAPADTPAEIRKKVTTLLPPDTWSDVTEFYELVRYGETDAPAAEQDKLFALLGSLSKK